MRKNKSFKFFLIYLLVSIIQPKCIHALDGDITSNDINTFLSSFVKESKPSDADKNLDRKSNNKISDSDRLTRVEEEIERLNHKFSLLDSSDKIKKTEIGNILNILARIQQNQPEKLKHEKEKSNMRNEIDEMKERLVHIETTIFSQEEEDLTILNNHRNRRATNIRELSTPPPCNFRANCAFDFKNRSHEEHISKPPTSCMDLRKNGHVLNGYYHIKSGENKVALVFCNFNQNRNFPLSPNIGFEILIGSVDIKTRSVHFFVQRKTPFSSNAIITFEIQRLNVGGAMNLTTGVFTAPVSGIYQFQFSGCKDRSSGHVSVEFQLNGNQIGYGAAGKYGSNSNVELKVIKEIHVALQLKIGDRVNLYKNGPAALDDAIGYPSTHFTGSLLEEDLELA